MYILRVNHLIWSRKYDAIEGNRMAGIGEEGRGTIRPEFNHPIMINFQGAKITSETQGRQYGGMWGAMQPSSDRSRPRSPPRGQACGIIPVIKIDARNCKKFVRAWSHFCVCPASQFSVVHLHK